MAKSPTVYRWDDAGAPDINTLMPSTNDKSRLWMHTVMRACLVDGYGAQEAAGWTMPHEEINDSGCRFAIENAAKSGSLLYESGVFSGGATQLGANTLWVCSAVPDLDSPVNAWSNDIEYSQRNSSAGKTFHGNSGGWSYWSEWIVIANENTVLIIFSDRGVDFDLDSASAPYRTRVCRLSFGVMHDGLGLGGVAAPLAGNFWIMGGVPVASYAGYVSSYSFKNTLLTSNMGLTGLAKQGVHKSTGVVGQAIGTKAGLNAWAPMPYIYTTYGDSAPDGVTSYFPYHSATVVGLRQLLMRPYDIPALNSWMKNNNWQYGIPFLYFGSMWLIVKSSQFIADVVCLDVAEWGG